MVPSSKKVKIRADSLLVKSGVAETRAKAQALLMGGKISVDGTLVVKPGALVLMGAQVSVAEKPHPWVSRGGIKLAAALKFFSLSPKGKVAADIGASTGGFTDVLLENGAKKVYAIDVGRAQLAHKIRSDTRVVVMEGVNARYLGREDLNEGLQVITCDVSFIGLEKVLPSVLSLADPSAWLIALIKPQFQLPKGKVGKGGIVKDEILHKEACDFVSDWLENCMKWRVKGIAPSPILGAKGNQEFVIGAEKGL